MESDIFSKLGISKSGREVYKTLAKSGQLNATDIERKSGLHRPAVYRALEELIADNLVGINVKGKTKYYSAESPDNLLMLAESIVSEVESELPNLKDIYKVVGAKPLIKLVEGKEGIASVFWDVVNTLEKGDTFYRYSSAKDVKKVDKYLPKKYREIRDKKKLERLVIASKRVKSQKKPRLEREIKLIPEDFDLFEYDVTQIIYDSKIAFIDYNTETAVIIENPLIAKFQKRIFELLYKML